MDQRKSEKDMEEIVRSERETKATSLHEALQVFRAIEEAGDLYHPKNEQLLMQVYNRSQQADLPVAQKDYYRAMLFYGHNSLTSKQIAAVKNQRML
ncbi:hypothetical protein GF351_05715 [Candidatus Woesearchaeota archaeon]|nr:hypothetical protein [Candidatus Woesearchaeota archaeon]